MQHVDPSNPSDLPSIRFGQSSSQWIWKALRFLNNFTEQLKTKMQLLPLNLYPLITINFFDPNNDLPSQFQWITIIMYFFYSPIYITIKYIVLSNIQPLIKLGYNICTLDLSGSGLSEGEYVTLGALEKYDVLELVKYLQKTYKNYYFIIWGRSMGAVTAIKFYSLFNQQKDNSIYLNNIKIIALILDSPFVSLNQLAIQIAKNKINMPQLLIKMAFFMIQSTIQSKANFKISQLELIQQVQNIDIPTLIITSKNDTLISSQHSISIYNKISSNKKQLLYIQTQHNSNRQQKDINKIYKFIEIYNPYCNKRLGNEEIFFSINNINNNNLNHLNNKKNDKSKSLKKYENKEKVIQIQKQKQLSKYSSQKCSIHISKINQRQNSNIKQHFPVKDLLIQHNNLKQARMRQVMSYQHIQQNNHNNNNNHSSNKFNNYNQYHQNMHQNNQYIHQMNRYMSRQNIQPNINVAYSYHHNIRQFYSQQRPKAYFNHKHIQLSNNHHNNHNNQVINNFIYFQQNQHNKSTKKHSIQHHVSPVLRSIPETHSLQKPLKQTKSYKNIQCLKTVKKIKKLQQQQHNIKNDQKQKQDSNRNHLNIIQSKLKKKSKNQLMKSFIPTRVQTSYPSLQTSQRIIQLQKQKHTKSQMHLQLLVQNNVNQSVSDIKIQIQRPITPVFFSNRHISYQNTFKPFTPQIAFSNASKRMIQVHNKRKKSFDQNHQIHTFQSSNMKNSSIKGIRTTLNSKYSDQKNPFNQIGLKRHDSVNKQAQFILAKKVLTSQSTLNRNPIKYQQPKKYIISKVQAYPRHDTQQETSITMN